MSFSQKGTVMNPAHCILGYPELILCEWAQCLWTWERILTTGIPYTTRPCVSNFTTWNIWLGTLSTSDEELASWMWTASSWAKFYVHILCQTSQREVASQGELRSACQCAAHDFAEDKKGILVQSGEIHNLDAKIVVYLSRTVVDVAVEQ